MKQRLQAIALTLIMVMAGAFGFVLAKLAFSDDVPPFTFVWLQYAIGGLAITLYTFVIRRERIPNDLPRNAWSYILWIGLLNFVVVRVMFLLALERLPATTHAYLINFVGIATMVLSIYFLGERPSFVQMSGALLAVLGLRVFFQALPAPP